MKLPKGYVRRTSNYLIYFLIGAGGFAQSWPDKEPLTWKFFVGVPLAGLIVVKGLMSNGAEKKDEPGV